MAQQPKVVKMGPGRNAGPRPKVENPGKVFKRILAYVMKQYKFQVILVLCGILLGVFAQVQGTLFMQTLIDSYILPLLAEKSNDFSGLLHAITRVACFYGVGILAFFIQNRTMAKIAQGTLKRLRDDLFVHMQTLPIKYFDSHAHGDIMSVYTNDIDTLRQLISQSLPQLVNTIITVVS
uniref:ABC transporter transmembrane domain-containing protein n=2 Tax=Gemmiger TaxID=204475 RepID=UPI004025AC5B